MRERSIRKVELTMKWLKALGIREKQRGSLRLLEKDDSLTFFLFLFKTSHFLGCPILHFFRQTVVSCNRFGSNSTRIMFYLVELFCVKYFINVKKLCTIVENCVFKQKINDKFNYLYQTLLLNGLFGITKCESKQVVS